MRGGHGRDDTAIRFAAAFYQGIACARSIRLALRWQPLAPIWWRHGAAVMFRAERRAGHAENSGDTELTG
ncbi:hypothetical protein GCM10010399_78970 [Dactylosporangium fulvum]